MKQLQWIFTAAAVLLILFLVWRWRGRQETFQLADTCGEGTACRTCADLTSCGKCLAQPNGLCGWCPTAKRCVAKVNEKPALPTKDGTYYIPKADGSVDTTCPAAEFVARKEDCSDFDCTSLTDCMDCYRISKCMFCTDTSKCYNKKADGTPDVPAGETACGAGAKVDAPAKCPKVDCSKLTSCDSCANYSDCGFCKSSGKCVTLNGFGQGVELDSKKQATVVCEQGDIAKGAFQCPGATTNDSRRSAGFGGSEGSTLSQKEANDAVAGMKQARAAGLMPGTDRNTEFLIPQTEGPVSPATGYTSVTAPGVARPVGSSGERGSYPAAAGLPQTGPFEEYIQVLVRSELSAQGIPVTEQFQAAPVSDVVSYAGTYVQTIFNGLMKPAINLRFLLDRN